MRPKQMRYVLFITVTAVLLWAALFLLREHILLPIGDFLVVQDELHPSDVIHVISGPDYRTDYAIQLYKRGYARQIFFTGSCWCGTTQITYAEYSKERAIEYGVPPQAIATDGSRVTSTYSEALKLKEWIEPSPVPIHSVIVVSDPYHMRRARWAYREVLGGEIRLQMAPVPFELSQYQRHWWTDGESRNMVRDEYLKILYYYARYRLSWGPAREWLASFDRD
jgi:uncharacterized SAM-binding protein YcdF (DUF218 family)